MNKNLDKSNLSEDINEFPRVYYKCGHFLIFDELCLMINVNLL